MTNSNPFNDPLDRILAEIAIRIQLPPSRYELACQRYRSVAEFAERPGSPLKDRITRFYPQGSMAIGTTIVTRGTEQDFDIDIVAELDLPLGSDPAKVLDALYRAIAGERGSRYFNMVKRRTRCITVYYEDGMHLDITPVIRRFDRAERTSDLFHDDPDKPSEPPVTLLMNAWGFAQVFKERTADTTSFAESYSRSSWAWDTQSKAETEEVDPQEDPARKSSDVVALQLIKQSRNVQYVNRQGRMPPSVLLSKYVSDAASPVESLAQALGHHAAYIRSRLVTAEREQRLVHEVNPTCPEDCFTDRWPLNRAAQRLYLKDLDELIAGIQQLQRGDISIPEMQVILVKLFGEFPVKAAVQAAQEHVGQSTQAGHTGHKIGGGLVIGSGASVGRTAPASTNTGGHLQV